MRFLADIVFAAANPSNATGGGGHRHRDPDVTDEQWIVYVCISIALVLMAGLMSGLTLGLMSLDVLDIEVLLLSQ